MPRPAAVFACNDTVGLKAAAACRRLGLAVPADVAMLGADNGDILYELSLPPLSGIALDLERIGWEAAEALAAFMDGKAGRSAPVAVSPREVVERQSTRAITMSDDLVDRAMAVTHGAPTPGLTVSQILRSVHCSFAEGPGHHAGSLSTVLSVLTYTVPSNGLQRAHRG